MLAQICTSHSLREADKGLILICVRLHIACGRVPVHISLEIQIIITDLD